MSRKFKDVAAAASYFVENNPVYFKYLDRIGTKVFAFSAANLLPNSWEKNLEIAVLTLLLKRYHPTDQNPAEEPTYIVAVTQRKEVPFEVDEDTDSYHVYRGDDENALGKAKDMYDNLLLQHDTYIAVLAKVIESTDY